MGDLEARLLLKDAGSPTHAEGGEAYANPNHAAPAGTIYDYDVFESECLEAQVLQRDSKWYGHLARSRWIVGGLVGITVGLLGALIVYATHALATVKYSVFNSLLNKEVNGTAPKGSAVAVLVAWSMAYGLVACAAVLVAPAAAGSGIPEIKCVLNGARLHAVHAVCTTTTHLTPFPLPIK